MKKFYTHVHMDKGKIKVRGYNNGRRYEETVAYQPYLFLLSKNKESTSKFRTLDDRIVEKLDFESIREAQDFSQKYADVSNFEIFGSTYWPYSYIYDTFGLGLDYDPADISVGNVDIEVNADEFPDPWKANWPITAITIKKRNTIVSLGLKDYKPSDNRVTYIQCNSEEELLEKFIEIWVRFDFDVITGWNIDFFDIPYLVNRIRKLLSFDDAAMLSPWKKIKENSVKHHGNVVIQYDLVGITSLDYMPLYKKFSFKNHESYALNNIAFEVLGEKKLDYSEYQSLQDLYNKDFKKFMDYNIKDVDLVDKLDNKLGLINQVFAIAYDSLVNYSDTFTSVKIWEIIIYNYLMSQNIVVPRKGHGRKTKQIVGGHVKDPLIGKHKWVISLDLDSLYPHLIMQYNISPETFIDIIEELAIDGDVERAIDMILNGFMTPERTQTLIDNDISLTAGGALFTKKKRGFVPVLMDNMYSDRKKFKKKMLIAKDELENIENEMKSRGMKL